MILLKPVAPPKPPEGEPCNGCGVCCAAEPCPLGMLLSRHRHGACRALNWDDTQGLYRCGVLDEPARWMRWIPQSLARTLARRWIAAGRGCDSDLEALPERRA